MSAPTAPVHVSQILQLGLDDIRTDGGTQTRARLDEDTLSTYGEALAARAIFPDIIVFFDGVSRWLADGFHRLETYRRAGRTTINSLVRRGTRRDAILYAAGANGNHGLPRTREDKRRAVLLLLADPVWRNWADRQIARTCNVSGPFVASLRNLTAKNITDELTLRVPVTANVCSENGHAAAPAENQTTASTQSDQQRTYKTRHGTMATMRVRKRPISSGKAGNGNGNHKPPTGERWRSGGEVSSAAVHQSDEVSSSGLNILDALPEGMTITLRRCAANCWHGMVSDGAAALAENEAQDVSGLILALVDTLQR